MYIQQSIIKRKGDDCQNQKKGQGLIGFLWTHSKQEEEAENAYYYLKMPRKHADSMWWC